MKSPATSTATGQVEEKASKIDCVQVNGSSIKPWWIHHHYWAMVTMAILLTLPVDSRAVQAFVRKFLWWSTFQVSFETSPRC